MSRIDFKRAILAHHEDSPQAKALVTLALNGLFECLDELARHGHPLTVQAADYAYQGEEFPKMLYHQQFPQGKVFSTQQQVEQAGGGWSDVPLVEQPETDEERQDREAAQARDETSAATSAQTGGYPKKLYHRDIPGGVSISSPDQEDEYKGMGYTDVPQDRGDVNFGSKAAELEGTSDENARPVQSQFARPDKSVGNRPTVTKNNSTK